MDIADKVDDEAQRLRALLIVSTGLENANVLVQRSNDVLRFRQVRRQLRPVWGEREVDEVQWQSIGKGWIRAEIVRPVSSIDEIQAFFGDCPWLNAECYQLVNFRF